MNPYFPIWRYDWFSAVLINALLLIAYWRGYLQQTPFILDVDTLSPAQNSSINCNIQIGGIFPRIIWRTLDGTCNDLNYPEAGSVGTRFKRICINPNDLSVIEPENETLLSPNPRTVARKLLFPNTSYPKIQATHLNMLVAAWVSFMTDDWMDHGHVQQNETIDIPLDPDDPWYSNVNQQMSVFRSRNDETYGTKNGDENRPRTFQNRVTAWWDASNVYGTDAATNFKLRDPSDPAKMNVNVVRGIPIENGNEIIGFDDNWWLGKSLMVNLFILEHNYFVDTLRNYFIHVADIPYPGDEWAFQTARLVIAGLIAKIHTVEWTPAILGDEIGENIMMFNWYGTEWLNYGLNRANSNGYSLFQQFYGQFKSDEVAQADLDYANEETASLFSYESHLVLRQLTDMLSTPDQKILGGTQNTYGLYNFMEEFVSVYRFHSILGEEFELNCIPNITMWQQIDGNPSFRDYCIEEDEFNHRNLNNNCEAEVIPMSGILGHPNVIGLREQYSFDDIMYSFGTNHPTALHLFSYSKAMTEFADVVTGTTLDLATIDILRQRERGVHRYNDFRFTMGMPRIVSYDELIDDQYVIDLLEELYDSVDDMDFIIGLLVENQGGKRVPPGWIFGETSFALFILSASNRLKADRFYTDYWNDDVYTPYGRLWIERNSMADVIQRHYPSLRPFIGRNAFHTFFDGICDEDDVDLIQKETPSPTTAPTPLKRCPPRCKYYSASLDCQHCKKDFD